MGLFQLFAGPALLLAVGVSAITIPPTPSWPAGKCTDKSLTIPSWQIRDYEVAGGTATFRIANRASGASEPYVTCIPGKKECEPSSTGDEMNVNWSKDASGKTVIDIFEFWVCQDEGDTTIFTATGSTTITSCAGNDCVSPITYLAQGSLSLPVPLTPAQPLPPPGFDAPSCASVGKSLWTVANVEFQNYTKGQCKQWYIEDNICLDPSGVNFVSKGPHLKLNVTNGAIAHSVSCSFTPSYNNWDLPNPLRCTGGNFNEITLDVTWSGVAPNFNLKVEELWYCLENATTNVNPTVIVAAGSIPVTLSCESHTGITGKPDDIVTICTDPASSHAVDGAQLDKQTLPPYSLITAWPVHGGCTFDSVVNPTLYFQSLSFTTNPYPANEPNSATVQTISAGLKGPGFQAYSVYREGTVSGQGVDTVYNCNSYYDGHPRDQHWNCTFALNPHTKVITQEKAWECHDKDQKHPLYFTSYGSYDWSINPFYSCENTPYSNGTTSMHCLWHSSTTELPPGLPFDIPKIVVSQVNVLPPDYGPPGSSKAIVNAEMGVAGAATGDRKMDTVREGGKGMRKWRLVDGK